LVCSFPKQSEGPVSRMSTAVQLGVPGYHLQPWGPCCRLGQFEPLPPELRESIISSLDVRMLCTARLVCRPFRQTASSPLGAGLTSLTLSAGYLRSHLDVNFGNLPNVKRVTISHVDCEAGNLEMLGHHNICNAVTDLKVVNYRETPATSTLPEISNLRAMTVHGDTNALPNWSIALSEGSTSMISDI
jgi:hypothetical protein